MKLVKGTTREDRRRDVFWQRSFVEDDHGKSLCKIIVCVTQEFLSVALKREMVDIKIDNQMDKWFEEKTKELYEKLKLCKESSEIESLFDVYPQTSVMSEFAQSIQ